MTNDQPLFPPSLSSWTRRGAVLGVLAGVLLLTVSAPSITQSGTDAAGPGPDAFQAVLDSMRERYEFPGATAAYVWVDGPAGAAATGWADVEAGRPMTTTSRMLAASIGKTVVGATAAALAAEGVVDLDAPVARWLGDRPWFAGVPNHDRITLRHLLTHRSGLPDHVHLPAFAEALSRRWAAPGRPFSPEELVQFVGGHPPLFEAGTDWAYSDTGFLLAGLVLEAATGRDYYDLVQARFLGPLGLDDTAPSTRRALAGLATGYAADNAFGFPRRTTRPDGVLRWSPALEWTGGGLVSTAPDLARWGAALFGGEALSAAARARMLDAVPIAPGASDVGYGLGVAVAPSGPHGPVYGHGGWIPGYVSSLRYYDDPGVAVAFQINTDIGITDDTSAVVPALEARLAAVVIGGRRLGPTAGDAAPR